MFITGTGIPAGAKISSFNGNNQITMDANATATNTGTTLSFSGFALDTEPKAGNGRTIDVFAIADGSGGVVLRISPWTNLTTRKYAISKLNGIYVNTAGMADILAGDQLNVVSASQATYLGTFRLDSSSQVTDSTTKRFIWNMYNRKPRPIVFADTTNTWNYSTAAYRGANGTTAGVAFLIGVDPDVPDIITAQARAIVRSSTATGRAVRIGIGVDDFTTNLAGVWDGRTVSNASRLTLGAHYTGTITGAGVHFIAPLEYGNGTDTQTWDGDNAGVCQTGLVGSITC